jgi:aminoglycoside phosphotransferase (APT) family kinase protein
MADAVDPSGDGPAAAPEADAVAGMLRDAGVAPGPPSLTRIPGGASREVYLVDEQGADGQGGRWVLRCDPPGASSFAPLALEYELLEAARRAAVPAPAPLAFAAAADGALGGRDGYLMEHVPGDSVPPRLLRRPEYEAAREALAPQLGAALARIHSIEPGGIEGLTVPEGDAALAACDLWEEELDRIGQPLPGVEAGLRWLRLNAPDPAPAPALIHGDFRLGNFIVDEEGLAAVIDWELAHGGDPAEDIGWLTIRSWRFGNDELPVGGIGRLEPFLDAYEEAGGDRPGPERLFWWEAMGNVKWGVICARQALDHLSGSRPSHELASLGRRICEPEWDLLDQISSRAQEIA